MTETNKHLGPWTPLKESEVRYLDPHDGRTWELDGSPRWIVSITPCCQGEARHFDWRLSDRGLDDKIIYGTEKTLEAAKAKADKTLREMGYSFRGRFITEELPKIHYCPLCDEWDCLCEHIDAENLSWWQRLVVWYRMSLLGKGKKV